MNILLIDNYDSFTYNIVHAIGVLGVDITIKRNNEISIEQAIADDYEAIIISPGPCAPDSAGISCPLFAAASHKPMLGICLGMQAMVQGYGGRIIVQTPPNHGKVFAIHHDSKGVLHGLSQGFMATRYHSLIADTASFPKDLCINGSTDDNTIMAVSHRAYPHYGVQFHPESIRTTEGHLIFANFIAIVRDYQAGAHQP